MIYAQSDLLYDIIPNAPRSSFNPKVKPGPHAKGIVGCASSKPTDSVAKQVIQLSINQSTLGQATALSQPTQTMSVLSVQSLDQKGNQQPLRNRKRVKIIVRVGIRMKMPILMKGMPAMLGGTSSLNVRLSFLANCVRRITSLTCALELMKLRDS